MGRINKYTFLGGAIFMALFSTIAYGQIWKRYVHIPPLTDSLLFQNQGHEQELDPKEIKVMVWNIFKSSSPKFSERFKNNAPKYDLVLIQEAYLNEIWQQQLPLTDRAFSMAISFRFKRNKMNPTGVATLSRATPIKNNIFRTDYFEPFSHTPKSSLVSLFKVKNQQEDLMVVNTHAINFVSTKSFKKQFNVLFDIVKNHSGPIIWAGDFNTWNSGRRDYINQIMDKLNFSALKFRYDRRTKVNGLVVDHIYYKGLKAKRGTTRSWKNASDHNPLFSTFSLL